MHQENFTRYPPKKPLNLFHIYLQNSFSMLYYIYYYRYMFCIFCHQISITHTYIHYILVQTVNVSPDRIHACFTEIHFEAETIMSFPFSPQKKVIVPSHCHQPILIIFSHEKIIIYAARPSPTPLFGYYRGQWYKVIARTRWTTMCFMCGHQQPTFYYRSCADNTL